MCCVVLSLRLSHTQPLSSQLRNNAVCTYGTVHARFKESSTHVRDTAKTEKYKTKHVSLCGAPKGIIYDRWWLLFLCFSTIFFFIAKQISREKFSSPNSMHDTITSHRISDLQTVEVAIGITHSVAKRRPTSEIISSPSQRLKDHSGKWLKLNAQKCTVILFRQMVH